MRKNYKEEEIETEEYKDANEEDKYQRIIEIMKESAYKAMYGKKWRNKVVIEKGKIQKKHGKGYSSNLSQWWDEECTKVITERKGKYQEWRKDKTMRKYIKYKKAIAVTRKTIKTKKREDFKKFTKSE